jgi:hypothetical protein
MFYDFESRRKLSNITLTCSQSRVVNSVFWKKSPVTIWNSDRFHGKTTCAREIASYGLRIDISVFIVDSNKRRSSRNAVYVYQNTCQFVNMVIANDETVSTLDDRFVWFRPLTIGCKYLASVDILIILIRDDGCILSLQEYLKNIQYKQLVLLGDGKIVNGLKIFAKIIGLL